MGWAIALSCATPLLHSITATVIVFPTGQASIPQAAWPNEQGSNFAMYVQSQAGKQQMAAQASSVISLPSGVSLMGLPEYGQQLYVRLSYLQLRDRILQLAQDARMHRRKRV